MDENLGIVNIYSEYYTTCLMDNTLVSLQYKMEANQYLFSGVQVLFREIMDKKTVISLEWYNLKKAVQVLFCSYRVLYKLLLMFGLKKKTFPHTICFGPKTITTNLSLFDEYTEIMQYQLNEVKSRCFVSMKNETLENVSLALYNISKILRKFISFDNSTCGEFRNGKPVSLEFI